MRPTIVYVHPHLTMRSGSTEFVLNTAVGLQARGWPVVVVAIKADPAIVGDRRVEIVELGGPLPSDPSHWLGLPSLERRLFTALDRIPHKVLFPQVHPANYWAFAYKAARPWVPCVWMCQEPSAFVHSWANIRSLTGPMRLATIVANPVLQVLDRLLVAQTDHIVANSRFTAEAVQRIYRRRVDAIVYPGVQLPPPSSCSGEQRRDCILSLGRLTRFKRADIAVRAYALARHELGNAMPEFVIAGDGPELSALRNLARQLGVESHVCFQGGISEEQKWSLYARALIFIATAPREPFGMVCPEAMAAGAPVLAPDHGGPSETVIEGKTGNLYRAGDARDLADRIILLVMNSNMLAEMSRIAGRDARFRVEMTAADLEQVFRPFVTQGQTNR